VVALLRTLLRREVVVAMAQVRSVAGDLTPSPSLKGRGDRLSPERSGVELIVRLDGDARRVGRDAAVFADEIARVSGRSEAPTSAPLTAVAADREVSWMPISIGSLASRSRSWPEQIRESA
jgi:hypothetical protein